MQNVNSSRQDHLSSASTHWHQAGSPHSQSCELYISRNMCFLFISLLILTQVHSYPTKYQIYLKSINGPIKILLLNKRRVGSPLLVLPVPPPEDILRRARVDAADATERDVPPCPALVYPSQSTRCSQPAMKDIWTSDFVSAGPDRTRASGREYSTLHSVNVGHMLRPSKLRRVHLLRV